MAYILECKHIDKTYQTGKLEVPVLYDVNFTMEEGEYVAIMGPSGSGKSTLMNIIGCLDRLTAGELILDGQPVSGLSEKELADFRLKKVGFVFQTFQLLPGETALENVELPLTYAKVPRKNRREIALKALERVGLADRVDFKPSQLSGGQKQRVAIARAVVNHPKILLADEPTGALDSKSGRQVMELFRSLNEEGMSVLMITHDREIASYADRIVEIRDGVLTDGSGAAPRRPESEETAGTADTVEAAAAASTAKTDGIQAVMEDGFFDDVDEEVSDELAGGFFEDVEEPEAEGGRTEEILPDVPSSEELAETEAAAAEEAELFGEAKTPGLVTKLTDRDVEAAFADEAAYDGHLSEENEEAAFTDEKASLPEEADSDEAAVEILHLADEEGQDLSSANVRKLIDESGSGDNLPEEV